MYDYFLIYNQEPKIKVGQSTEWNSQVVLVKDKWCHACTSPRLATGVGVIEEYYFQSHAEVCNPTSNKDPSVTIVLCIKNSNYIYSIIYTLFWEYNNTFNHDISIQFNNFIPDSTEHIQQVYVTLRSICYIRYTICAVYKSTEQ